MLLVEAGLGETYTDGTRHETQSTEKLSQAYKTEHCNLFIIIIKLDLANKPTEDISKFCKFWYFPLLPQYPQYTALRNYWK